MKEAFENYVKKYDMTDPDILYKYKHSYRVLDMSEYLSEKLNLSKIDTEIAKIIGLYHDIGRFEEDKRFDKFGFHLSFDHGDYGKEVLIKEGLINEIPISNKYHDLIAKAVEIHNKYSIEEGLNAKTLMHCKIIRDADKIDILRSCSKGLMRVKNFNPKVKAKDVGEEVKEEFYKNVQIRKRKTSKHSEANRVLSFLALIYDINYKESIDYIVKNNIVKNLYNILEDKKGYKEYFDHIEEYIEGRKSKC